jgi:hypothetical protein
VSSSGSSVTGRDYPAPAQTIKPPNSLRRARLSLRRSRSVQLIEGGPEPKRIVIPEFADTASFKRWYDSPEYQKILPARLDNSTARAFVVEGVS